MRRTTTSGDSKSWRGVSTCGHLNQMSTGVSTAVSTAVNTAARARASTTAMIALVQRRGFKRRTRRPIGRVATVACSSPPPIVHSSRVRKTAAWDAIWQPPRAMLRVGSAQDRRPRCRMTCGCSNLQAMPRRGNVGTAPYSFLPIRQSVTLPSRRIATASACMQQAGASMPARRLHRRRTETPP